MTLSLDFTSELKKHFLGEIRLDDTTRVLYSTDASIYQVEPLGVVIPRTQDDLIAAVELAVKYKIPLLPRGSGSSLAGQAIGRAMIVDCSRYLDKITIPLDNESHIAKVEPGVILANLNRAAGRFGLMFGPDPASAERATMGGVIGNNATGAHSILYGMTADHLLSADVIFSDGSLATWGPVNERYLDGNSRYFKVLKAAFDIRENYESAIKENWPITWRNSAGYRLNYLIPWSGTRPYQWAAEKYPLQNGTDEFNLASLLAGSEGTLAIIRSATVNLVPKPKNTILGVLEFNSIAEACDAVPGLLEFKPSAVEIVPQMLIRLARSVPMYANQLGFVNGDPAALLVVEFSGGEIEELRAQVAKLGRGVSVAESPADQAAVWAVRKVGLGIFDSRPSPERPVAFIEDCAIPVENLGEFVREVERILSQYGTKAAFYGHASAGCLHIRPILNLKTSEGVRNLRRIASEVLSLTLRVGGSMSSEHGDGLVRSEWLKQTYGDNIIDAMKQLKHAADPESLLSPGKLTDAPVMDSNLRYGGEYRSRIWKTKLNFDRNGGMAVAIEQCNGQGVCRKFDGVMCPSFQATRDELFSTRGRANLLRALISNGGLGLPEAQVKQAMDLCLACKGCKVECPSGVDMAKLKYEFQSHYFESHKRPPSDYLFGYIEIFAKLGSPFGGVLNWITGKMVFRRLAAKLFGITEKRALPKFGYAGFNQKNNLAGKAKLEEGNRIINDVCLFLPDAFSHYFEPDVEAAAFQVLKACGVKVMVLPIYGAGRTLLSKGFIEPARNHALRLINEIRRLDPEGKLAVIGLEPSEIYTLRDDLIDLLPDCTDDVAALSNRAWLLDEYLVRPSQGNGQIRILNALSPDINSNKGSKVIVHGHCYQKAQHSHVDGGPVGVDATVYLLRSSGYNVELLNTGCCGMAGAFGYEAEHYDVSMQVGELELFPEIRQIVINDNPAIVAVGTSCRSQILDGTSIKAHHSVVMVAKKLA